MKIERELTGRFEVEAVSDDPEFGELTEDQARCAAGLAAFHYMTFVLEETQGRSTDTVTVDVDGFGECRVKLIEIED